MDYDALYRKRDAAARCIQAAWRARKGRKAFLRLRDAAHTIQAVAKGWVVRKKLQEQRNRAELEARFEAAMERRREKMRLLEAEKRALLALPGGEVEEWEARRLRAAVRVQAAWRGHVARRRMAASPERAKREAAARRIQGAFKKLLVARRSSAALSTAASAAAAAAFAARHGSPLGRASTGASVLLGSPNLRPSPSPGRSPAGGAGGAKGGALSPQALAAAAAASRGGGGGGLSRGPDVIGPKRYKQLQAQVDGKLAAYVALARTRGMAKRADPRATQERLSALLSEYHTAAPERLAAAAARQRGLVEADAACAALEAMVRPLAELPPDAAPQDFPRAARGSERAERAAQAHALALAEAKAGARWWAHLKGLNTQAVQALLAAEDEERWDAADARWRRLWRELEEQENRRPEPMDEIAAASGRATGGAGAAAVAAAREAAALAAKAQEYKTRLAAAAVALPERPLPGDRSRSPAAGGVGARASAGLAAAARR